VCALPKAKEHLGRAHERVSMMGDEYLELRVLRGLERCYLRLPQQALIAKVLAPPPSSPSLPPPLPICPSPPLPRASARASARCLHVPLFAAS